MDLPEARKKSNLLKELGLLDSRYESVVKEKEVYLYKRNPNFFTELIEQEKKEKADLKAEKIKTKKEIWRLRSMVQRFHEELKHVSPTPEFLEKVKEIMENIEKNLMEFKDSQREIFQQLMVSEAQHTHEIAAIEQKIESWSDMSLESKTVKPVTKLPTSRDVVKDLPLEVAQFEKFVQQNGGVRGGWDEYDHGTFLRWRVRYKGKPSFLTEAISRLPTKTDSEVREHEEWYQEFLRLQEIKKEAIAAWKIKKENEKKENGDIDDLSSDEEQKVMTHRQKEIIEKERFERQQQLTSWKLQKEIERAEEKERKEREERKKKEKEQLEQRKREEIKQHVIDYKNRKREEEDFLAMQEEIQREYEEAEKRRELRLNQGRIELRNHIAFDSRIKRAKDEEQKRAKQKEKEKKLKEQYSVPVKRDPNRLLQPTAGWQARTKEVGASNESGRVYQFSHRAVPSWRQGL